MSIPKELPHEEGYVDTGGRAVDDGRTISLVLTGHVEGIKSESPVPDDFTPGWYQITSASDENGGLFDPPGASAAERTQQAKLRGEADVIIDKLLKKVAMLEALVNHKPELSYQPDDDGTVEWWYRHEFVGKLQEWGFDEDMAVALANKALSEHYLVKIYAQIRQTEDNPVKRVFYEGSCVKCGGTGYVSIEGDLCSCPAGLAKTRNRSGYEAGDEYCCLKHKSMGFVDDTGCSYE